MRNKILKYQVFDQGEYVGTILTMHINKVKQLQNQGFVLILIN